MTKQVTKGKTMKKKAKKSPLQTLMSSRKAQMLAFIAVFALIGSYFVFTSFANPMRATTLGGRRAAQLTITAVGLPSGTSPFYRALGNEIGNCGSGITLKKGKVTCKSGLNKITRNYNPIGNANETTFIQIPRNETISNCSYVPWKATFKDAGQEWIKAPIDNTETTYKVGPVYVSPGQKQELRIDYRKNPNEPCQSTVKKRRWLVF